MRIASQFFILSYFFLTSCTVPLSQSGANVIETNDEAVVQCDFIGIVRDHAPLGGFSAESSKNDFRSQAATMGATHIVYKTTTSGSVTGAKAYRCLRPVINEGNYRQDSYPPPIDRQPPSNSPPPVDSGYRRY